MSFDIIDSKEFFELLYQDEKFCSGVGKVVLAASVLEAKLRDYLAENSDTSVKSKATLGYLINLLKVKGFLSSKIDYHFDDLVHKRNYLAHSIYDLFNENIDETILQRTNLVEMDTDIFSDRAHQLADELLYFAKIVENSEGDQIG